jgi:hypothetical protein
MKQIRRQKTNLKSRQHRNIGTTQLEIAEKLKLKIPQAQQ